MKTRRLIISYIIPALLVVVGMAWSAWRYTHPRQLPLSQCSVLLREYRKVEGIQASYLKDFPLDDTLSVSVTILTATDSASWIRLLDDFHSPTDTCNYPSPDMSAVKSFMCPKDRLGLPMATTSVLNNDYIIISPHNKTLCIYHIECEEQMEAILLYKIRETLKKRKNQ